MYPADRIIMNELLLLCRDAGKAIMEVYSQEFSTEFKPDHSPVTAADHAAQRVLISGLNKLYPDIPIVSEEKLLVGYGERKSWKTFWMLDPLDGTREFIKRNDEFSINIALIENDQP